MEKARTRRRAEQGFTLIEVIAALFILGLLAAVAIPKYNALQKEAQIKTAKGALPALTTAALNAYHNDVLASPTVAGAWSKTATATVGDFVGTYGAAANVVTVGVTSTANALVTWWAKVSSDAGSMTYQFTIPNDAAGS